MPKTKKVEHTISAGAGSITLQFTIPKGATVTTKWDATYMRDTLHFEWEEEMTDEELEAELKMKVRLAVEAERQARQAYCDAEDAAIRAAAELSTFHINQRAARASNHASLFS